MEGNPSSICDSWTSPLSDKQSREHSSHLQSGKVDTDIHSTKINNSFPSCYTVELSPKCWHKN